MEYPNDANSRQIGVRDIEDLEDANNAGPEKSQNCTLILTDGHAAKLLAIAGVNAIDNGRDWYGVYPLERRLINVSKKTREEVETNEVVLQLVAILGLRFNGSYKTEEDLRTLRYNHVMLMMNRDEDGSHKKGLLINLFRCYWPDLFRNGFIQQFITPVVKVSLGNNQRLFYSYQKFKFKIATCLLNRSLENCSIKYYKSLESFTSTEIKHCFSNMHDHCVLFTYHSTQDDVSFNIAFEEGLEDERKKWLKISEKPLLYEEGMNKITYKDFIDKELKFYSKLHNIRSFPSVIDGLKRGERNVLRACFEKWADQEVNILALIHSVLEGLAYTQRTESLGQTVINMAQDFVGKNNVNLLQPLGQFGTRLRGGKDAGKVENLHIKLQDFARVLFSGPNSTPVPDCRKIFAISEEPWYYIPILPMILVNGVEGIGTGYKTRILSYHPKDIIRNIHCLLNGEEPPRMEPWFRGFRGKIKMIAENSFRISGVVSNREGNQIDITELPIGMWTQEYKRNVLEVLKGKQSTPRVLHYTEHHTDTSVHFRVTLDRIPCNFEEDSFLEFFKLNKDIKEKLVALDIYNCEKEYKTVNELLSEFCESLFKEYSSIWKEKIRKLKQQHDELSSKLQKINQRDHNMQAYGIGSALENLSMIDTQSDVGKERSELEKEINDRAREIEHMELSERSVVLTMWNYDLNELKKLLDFDNLL